MSLIYGVNPVTEAVASGKTINKIYAQKGNKEIYELVQKAKKNHIVVVEADKSKLDRMITEDGEKLKNSQGIVASVTEYNYFTIDDILKEASDRKESPFIIILDKIEDPHNLGAIVRSAECLGAHGIIIQKRNASQVTDTVEKVAAGACNYMKIARVTNITESIKYLKEKGLSIFSSNSNPKLSKLTPIFFSLFFSLNKFILNSESIKGGINLLELLSIIKN